MIPECYVDNHNDFLNLNDKWTNESVLSDSVFTCVSAPAHYPSTDGLGRLEQTMTADVPQFGLEVKVRNTSMYGDEEFGEFEAPLIL